MQHVYKVVRTSCETLDSRAAHRYSLVTQLRYEAFEQAISRQALTSTKKDDRKFELGDGVIYQLTKKDSEKDTEKDTDKLMLAWSEPMRITKVLHPQQETYLLESVWHKGSKRQVNKRSHVVSIQCQIPDLMNGSSVYTIASGAKTETIHSVAQ